MLSLAGIFIVMLNYKNLILIVSLLLSNTVLAIWKGPGKISAVQPEIHRKAEVEGGYPIFIETNIPSTDCGGTTWAIRSDTDDGGRIYSAVLAAYVAGKNVDLHQWSCYTVDGKTYPRVGAVKISD